MADGSDGTGGRRSGGVGGGQFPAGYARSGPAPATEPPAVVAVEPDGDAGLPGDDGGAWPEAHTDPGYGGYETPTGDAEPGVPDDGDGADGEGWSDYEEWSDGDEAVGTGRGVSVAPRGVVRRRLRHPVLAVFLSVALVVILLVGAGVLWVSHQVNPGGHTGAKVLVTIPAGASTAEIGRDLAQAGVIHQGTVFRYYAKLFGGGGLLSGSYLLPKNESYDQVITALQAGPVIVTDKLVIPEGFTLRQIAARVAKLPGMHLSAAKFLALSSRGSVRSPLEPKGVNNLEGLVFPATYTLLRTDSESTILEEMVGTFDQRVQALGLTAGAAKLHMTPYQVVEVASIIEGEAKFAGQFPDVASVLYNRLASGTPLGSDSTLIYALRRAHPNLNVAKVNVEQPNAYNTRLHKGLPPTPINSPSIQALAAAISPPHTNLQYFVEVNPNGTLGFASTSAGFQQLINQCNTNHLNC